MRIFIIWRILRNFGGGTDVCVMLASTNPEIYGNLKSLLLEYIDVSHVEELDFMVPTEVKKDYWHDPKFEHHVGKYCYGPLAYKYHPYISYVGSFCSFAQGADVVLNHSTTNITTHPIMFVNAFDRKYDDWKEQDWYFPGIHPRGVMGKNSKSKIGNDVWLGRNVIVTNGANIGNGVIAAAGAVITKDVPDYAIVAGVPARIIKYRYNPAQIAALNRIAWWDWSDDEIRERYDDFYLPIDEFIKKYDT